MYGRRYSHGSPQVPDASLSPNEDNPPDNRTGLIAELYYVIYWKKRYTNMEIQDSSHPTNATTELSFLFCWRSPISSRKQQLPTSVKNGHDQDLQMLKIYNGEEGVESELMRLHNLCGPPRFLFTIKEETKEDLESEDEKSRGERSFSRKGSRNKSLAELLVCVETPYLSPLASPIMKKSQSLDCYSHHGFNPFFESSTDAEINKLRLSPPPKLKFLKDAEEKLMKKLMEDAVSETKQTESHSTASSQVLPLATSPPTFEIFDKKSNVQ
ncbi:hypothetical protein AgCh_022532 [Apium graveolens]